MNSQWNKFSGEVLLFSTIKASWCNQLKL